MSYSRQICPAELGNELGVAELGALCVAELGVLGVAGRVAWAVGAGGPSGCCPEVLVVDRQASSTRLNWSVYAVGAPQRVGKLGRHMAIRGFEPAVRGGGV